MLKTHSVEQTCDGSYPMSAHKSSALPAPVTVKQETPVCVESILETEDESLQELKDDMKILTYTRYQGFTVTNTPRRMAGEGHNKIRNTFKK